MDVSPNARGEQRHRPSPTWRGTQVVKRRRRARSAPGGTAPREAQAGKGVEWRHSRVARAAGLPVGKEAEGSHGESAA